MSNTNGWPDRPGYPLHPERDGWHWMASVHFADCLPTPVAWDVVQGTYLRGLAEIHDTDFAARNWRYLGPCFLPSDLAAAVQAERAECADACERKRIFADADGPHTCTTINNALWYGRAQYAASCRDAIRARGDASALDAALAKARREGMEAALEAMLSAWEHRRWSREEITEAVRAAAGEEGK